METVDRYDAKSLNIKTVNALEINTVWKYVHMNDQKSIRKPPTKSINTKLFKQNAPQSAEMQGKELLPHEAMHNSGLCSLSVCPSVTFEILSKWINISSKFFRYQLATPFQFFHTKHYGNIPTRTP